jgi:ATP-dependent helicase HepA
MSEFRQGQKWISTAEPEMGMGRVTEVTERTVSLAFDMVGEARTYASRKAPLTRVRFNIGDPVTSDANITITVTAIEEKDAILTYYGEYSGADGLPVTTEVPETSLDPNVRFSKPEDRLFSHQLDLNPWFNLRYDTRHALAAQAVAPSRGLYGPRVSLIPHQLYIGNEVAKRFAPRVLLADEVGLGKTIEAGLIVHQQLLTGRASRILILVPPALTFQWFVEMIRRFNLHFTLLDEARCLDIMADNANAETTGADASEDTSDAASQRQVTRFNPFEAQQLMLCNLDLFIDNPQRLEQALATDWDLVVVDEAHHLQWSATEASPAYQVVESIAAIADGLLLLTATPEQLGRLGHFARLRLLDPARYHHFEDFLEQESHFQEIAAQVSALLDGKPAEKNRARRSLQTLLGDQVTQPSDAADFRDNKLVTAVLDRHGTGRVLFRNVRSSVKGFPKRFALPYPLGAAKSAPQALGYFPEQDLPGWTNSDPRVAWLGTLLHSHPEEKFLLICAHQQTVLDLEQKLAATLPVRTSVFHEGMDLVARDRAANYFAETDRGAQLLLCSEIGSEGRNFQFASHLILFDLPLGPDLLEQRIGRLDRIGQQADVKIHIPYIEGSKTDYLYQWYANGLELFDTPNAVAQGIFDELFADFAQSCAPDGQSLPDFIERSLALNSARLDTLHQGRDRLLELNSHRPEVSASIVADIQQHEGGAALATYMEHSFALFGLEAEPLSDTVFLVKPGDGMARHFAASAETQSHFHYPELPDDGLRITYDRATALAREDVQFLTWEHPLVQQAMDMIATDINGNSTMIAIRHPDLPPGTLLLETLFIADCAAPVRLMADRYLPPTVIRLVIEPGKKDVSARLPWTDFEDMRLDVSVGALHGILESQRDAIKQMLEAARELATVQLDELRSGASERANASLTAELERMAALQRVNDTVRPEEVLYLQETRSLLLAAIQRADVRLDGIRVIVAA